MAASVEHVLSQIQRWTSSHLADASDAVLLERFVQRRDEAAFAALVARHGAMVLRACRRVLGDAQEAEDAFQATFLILARKAPTLRRPDALSGWLHGVARHVALNARRKSAVRSGEILLPETLPDPRADPLARLTARELLTVLDEEVQRLPAVQRSAVVLCCLEGHPQDEAARMLGCTAGSLKGHLERGRRRLQARLMQRGVALPAALAIVAVSRGEVTSALLRQSAVRIALGGAGGSPLAAALAASVLKGAFAAKLAGVTAVVLTVALTASATVALVYRGPAAEAPEDKKTTIPAAPKEAGVSKPQARTDALGDPLPPGAIARLGTVRFRHRGGISQVRFTPDGKRLVSKGGEGVRIWDPATGKELRHLTSEVVHEWEAMELSPDGKQLAVISPFVAGGGGHIDLWDVDTGKKIGSLGERFYRLARFTPNSKLLAASDHTLTHVELWDVAHQKKLRSWQAHAELWQIAFTADARNVLTIGRTGKVRLWETATGRQLQEFTPACWKSEVKGIPPTALSPDGNLLAISEANEKYVSKRGAVAWKARISLWDVTTGKQVWQRACPSREMIPGYTPGFSALAFSSDGKRLITGGPDASIRFWDPATGEERRRLPFEPGFPSCLALSPDGKSLAAGVYGGFIIRVVDLANGKARLPPFGHLMMVEAAVLTPDGRTAVTGDLEGSLLVWDVASGRPRRRLEGHTRGIDSLWIAPDGRTLVSSGWDMTLRGWDLSTGAERWRLKVDPLRTAIGDRFVSYEGKTLLITADSTRTIRLLDAVNGEEQRHFQAPERIVALKLLSDGRSLAAWSGDRTMIRVWDVTTGRLLREHPLRQDLPGAMSPDGRLLALTDAEPKILKVGVKRKHFLMLKDLVTGHEVHRLDDLPPFGILAFSPDGRMLAWFEASATIHVLETASGRERLRLAGDHGTRKALTFSASGDRLISGSGTAALVWDLGSRFNPNKAPIALSAKELETLWADLGGEDAARAYQAIRKLAAAPDASVPFLRKRLRPVPPVDEKGIARLIADLDNDDFAVRRKAAVELTKLRDQPLAAYRKALEGKPSLETRRRLEDLLEKAASAWWDVSGERLRSLRAIEALELAGTKEARETLAALAAGAPAARLTEQAKAALERRK